MDKDYFDWEVDKVQNQNDVIRLIIAIVSAVKLLLAALGWKFFTDDVLVALETIIPLLILLWTTWKNNYISKRGKAQKIVLAKNGLIDEKPEDVIKP